MKISIFDSCFDDDDFQTLERALGCPLFRKNKKKKHFFDLRERILLLRNDGEK